MLLKSSLFILLLVNIFTSNLIILSVILIIVLILNFTLNKNLRKHSKQLKVLLFFYITQEGLINFGVSFIRILNLILMSWLINEMKLLTGRFSKYQKIIDTVIDLVPEVFVLFKKRMKAKNFTRYILKDISKRYE